MKVKRLSPGSETDESLTIVREYDDFEFLHHVLTTNNTVRKLNGKYHLPTKDSLTKEFSLQIFGLIIPPLPPRPAADPKATENKSVSL